MFRVSLLSRELQLEDGLKKKAETCSYHCLLYVIYLYIYIYIYIYIVQ